MGLFDFLKRNQSVQIQQPSVHSSKELEDLKLSIGQLVKSQAEFTQVIKSKRQTLSRPLMYSNPSANGGSIANRNGGRTFHGPVHNLAEIARIMDIEAYVNQSVRKHREQILKEGYTFTGEDEAMVEYVRNRIFEIELASGCIFEEIIRDYATSLVAFGTSFLVKKRDRNRSSGKEIRMYGKTLEPIAAVFHMDPTSVTVSLNEYGHPTQWRQEISRSASSENVRFYSNSEIICATVDKKPGFVFGTPYILPVIDDVRALRKLEEIAEIIARKYAFPSVHWQVGDEKMPPEIYDDNSTELDLVRREIENMTPEGGIVTSHRVKHEVIASADSMYDLTPLIGYYEARVLGGLRLSPTDLGRGDVSKASANVSSRSLQDSSRDFQAILEAKLTYDLILPLLLEGGFDVNRENMVHFKFPMIDREEERANQQHGADLCNSSVITCTEYRRDYLNKKALTDEEKMDTKDAMNHERDMEGIDLQGKISAATAAARPSSSNSSKKKSDSSRRSIQNKVRPRNQNGRKAIKTSITANNSLEDVKRDYASVIISDLIDEARKYAEGLTDEPTYDIQDASEEIMTESVEFIHKTISSGINDALMQMDIGKDEYKLPKRSLDRFIRNYVNKDTAKVLEGTKRWLGKHKEYSDGVKLSVALGQFESDMRYALDRQIDIAYRFGFIKAMRHYNRNTVYAEPVDGLACDDCMKSGSFEISIDDKDMPYNLLLKTHADCIFDFITTP
jgi:hypothetical protein